MRRSTDLLTPPLNATDMPMTRLLPNLITVMSLCSGLTGLRFALRNEWAYAVLAIMAAMVFDILDGRVARLLKMTSKFGAELDSLSDAVSFGVVPGFVMYQWALKDAKDIGWIAVLIFAVCGALRLARFNTMVEDHAAPLWAQRYFTGVPIPAGAGLALLPLLFTLEHGDNARLPAEVSALWLMLVGGLMISRLPTFALKGWRIEPLWVAPLFIVIVTLIAALVTNTWLTLEGLGTLYVASLPLAWLSYRARAQKDK